MTEPTPPAQPAGEPVPGGQLLIYQDGAYELRVRLDGSTVWLTQAQMAELYQVTPQAITNHIKEVYADGELPEGATCKDYLQVRSEGGRQVSGVDPQKPNLGLRTWKNAPAGPIRRADVTVAKNYLSPEELDQFNRIVSMYLDYAEEQARRHRAMHMAEWAGKLGAFLAFNERAVLTHAGRVSHGVAEKLALEAFAEFEQQRPDVETSDFDQAVKRLNPPTRPGEKGTP